MTKKLLSIASLSFLAIALSVLLSGCWLLPQDEENDGATQESAAADDNGLAVQQAPVETPPAAPVITDAELEAEVAGIDAELNSVKSTGFEPKDLSDKDLGL